MIGVFVVIVVTLVTRFWQLEQRVDTLWVDEAWFSVKGTEITAGGDLIPLEPPGIGRGDSLFQIYSATLMRVLGAPDPFLSRYSSAVMGSLLVGALAFFWERLWRKKLGQKKAIWAALAGAFILSTTFTAILHSRQGLQMSAAALLTVVVLWFLWRTLTHYKFTDALLTGLFLAVSLTTYEAALGLPLVVTILTGIRWWVNRQKRGRIVLLLILMAGSSVLFFSPMIAFYARNPGIFLGHVRQTQEVVEADSGPLLAQLVGIATSAAEGVGEVILSIFAAGDSNFGRNLPGRPLFDFFVAFWVGVGALWTLLRGRWTLATQLLLVWLVIMILPAALSDTRPAFSRMLPLVPLLAGWAGLGVVVGWRWVVDHRPSLKFFAGPLITVALAVSGVNNWLDYLAWSENPALFDFFYQGARQTAEQAITLNKRPDHSVMITNQSGPFTRFPFQLLLDPEGIPTFDVSDRCFPYPAAAAETVWYGVIHELDEHTVDHLRRGYGEGVSQKEVALNHPVFGDEFATFYAVLPDTSPPIPQTAVAATFGSHTMLIGYDVTVDGDVLTLMTYWKGERLLDNAKLFVHIGVGDQSEPLLVQSDETLCPGFGTVAWQPDRLMVHRSEIVLPADPALSRADIRIGLTGSAGTERLPITAATNRIENNRLILENVVGP